MSPGFCTWAGARLCRRCFLRWTLYAETRQRGGGDGLPLFVERELREFLSSHRARAITVFAREADVWTAREYGPGAVADIPPIACRVDVDAVYDLAAEA